MKPEMKGILNKIISAVLFVSMAACFIIQTYTQVEKFFMGQVVQGTDTYVPDVVQLPTLIVCREMSAALDKSLLEQKGLPRNMFSGLPLDLNVVNMIPFPDLKQTWELVTMNLNVSGGTRLTYSEVNTQYQGRCYKIDKAKSFPGGTRITSWLKFKTKKRDSAAYSIFFGYNINMAGIVVDYTPVPYDETLIRNRTLSFLHIG